ncbi:hypothetical protein K440DRAFT_646967 [Wilcoxina mikolae CBS 423.85]|nr:hypothetical protein K440DRAFT_646967 [Wilcoxina mikolae CBS 423.85]
MYAPGNGNSCLEVGQRFVISIYGTQNVLTAEGDEPHAGNHFGFVNIGTGKCLGRKSGGIISCVVEHLQGWESLIFTRLCAGGYRLFSSLEGDPVFRCFKWVIPGRLARSSSPHYESHDEDQNMDIVAVQFLARQGITNIINLNTSPMSWKELTLLFSKGITYTHVAIQDFRSPTLTDFDTINSSSSTAGCTLLCGGFGHGRVGTAISALQLYTGRRLRRTDFKANYVQTEAQFDALDRLKDKLER